MRASKKSTVTDRSTSDASDESPLADNISIGSGSRKPGHIYARYSWRSNWEYLGTVLVSSINIYNYHRMANRSERSSLPMLHFFIIMMVYALPLQYMQVTQGQFTQAGVAFLKYLCPLAYGLGYMFIISTMFRLVYIAVLGSDFMLYFFYSMQLEIPWFSCPINHTTNCWDSNTCKQKQPCLSKDIDMSTTVYWNHTFMLTITDKISFDYIYFKRYAALAIFWGCVIWTLMFRVNTVSKTSSRIIFGLCMCLVIIILIALIYTDGAFWALVYMFNFQHAKTLLDYRVWSETIADVITLSGLAKGGYILLGSYLHPNSPSGVLSVLSGIIYILAFTLLEAIAQSSLSLTLNRAKLKMKDKDSVLAYSRGYEIFELMITPKGFQFTQAPQLFTLMYFFMCVVLSGVFVVTNVKIMEVCIEDCHPQFMRYRNYILILYYLLNLLLSVVFMIPGFYRTATSYYLRVVDLLDCLNMLIYTLITAWLYSVQHLSDDIHYISGAQPSKFWKLCWIASPVITAFGFGYTVAVTQNQLVLIFLIISYIPFILMGGVQGFKYVKSRNLFGLFQAEERWGPPDSTYRNNRRIFNPRKEIRSRRRFDKCVHNCLRDSKVLKHVKDDEMKYYMYTYDVTYDTEA